jgi:hypothetical protein
MTIINDYDHLAPKTVHPIDGVIAVGLIAAVLGTLWFFSKLMP